MKDWARISDAKDFAPCIKKIRDAAIKAEARVQQAASSEGVDESVVCRGASRILFNIFFYVGWIVPLALSVAALTELQVNQVLDPELLRQRQWIQLIPLFVSVIVLWQMAASRLKHAGYSRARGLTIFVPVFNLWTFFICLCAPRNFARKKKLGRGAAVYFLIMLVFVSTIIAGWLLGLKLKQFSPLAVNAQVTELYEDKTHFRDRYNKKIQQAKDVEANREQMQRQKEAEAKARNKAMLNQRGVQ